MTRVLVSGGARSGKSTLAESLVGRLADATGVDRAVTDATGAGPVEVDAARVDYVATGFPADPGDAEWAERIRVHQQRRPASWRTIETLDVAGVLLDESDVPVLVDCLGLWLTRTIDACQGWDGGAYKEISTAVDVLVGAVRDTRRPVVFVTNEVGLGLVPETASGRLFRDWLGRVNMQVAAVCDTVALCVCGIPMALKGALPTALAAAGISPAAGLEAGAVGSSSDASRG